MTHPIYSLSPVLLRRVLTTALISMAAALAACGDEERGSVVLGESTTPTTGTTATETTGAKTSEAPASTSPTTTGPGQPAGEPVATIEVEETEYELTPAKPEVEEAGVVVFEITNSGEIAHALEVEGPGGEQETGEIGPGKSAQLTVDLGEPGTYKWYCPIADHEDRGMVGEIVVGSGTDSGSGSDDKDAGSESGRVGGY